MIELIAGLPKNVVGIFVRGRVTRDECRDVLTPAVERTLKRHDKIRLYYELGSRFPGAAWDELDLGSEHAARCERVAIVTDTAWVGMTVKALRFLIPGEIRVFATSDAEEGRHWIVSRHVVKSDAERMAPMRPARRRLPSMPTRGPRQTRSRRRVATTALTAQRQAILAAPESR